MICKIVPGGQCQGHYDRLVSVIYAYSVSAAPIAEKRARTVPPSKEKSTRLVGFKRSGIEVGRT